MSEQKDLAKEIKDLATLTRFTGQIFELQIAALKSLGIWLFGHPVTLTIQHFEEGTKEFSESKRGVVNFYTRAKYTEDEEIRAEAGVLTILGPGWPTKIHSDDYREEPKPADARPEPKLPKRKRTKSAKRLRSKSKPATRRKN